MVAPPPSPEPPSTEPSSTEPDLDWRRAPRLLADRLGVSPAAVVLGLLAVVAAATGAWWAFRAPPTLVEEVLPLVGDVVVAVPSTTTAAPVPLVVHVDGAVAVPGVHEVVLGSRVVDAIEAAGGLTEDADRSRLNLALLVEDEQRVWVPRIGEEEPSVVTPTGGGGSSSSADGGIVDINHASAAELEALPGIGPSLAAAIVDHRQRQGPFSSIEELLTVVGIGPAKLEQLRSMAGT